MRHSPLLASPQGVAERSKNIAKHPLIAKPVWFSDGNERKTTPAASVSMATRNFLMTQPPLAVMQGGDYLRLDFDSFTPYIKRRRSPGWDCRRHRPPLQLLIEPR